jgi:cytochrome c oxidase subunit 1
VAIGFISLGVWAHHMFTMGMPSLVNTFFAASTLVVGIPTAIKIFNWTATMYGGKIRFHVPMLFCCAFLLQFLLAGLTGIMMAVAPFDWQLNGSYFLVAHFHFTLIGGLIFGLFAGIYYWYPKATGKLLDETLGKWHFWLFCIGFNMTFIPLHFAGFLGMPRRIYTYPAGRGWEIWNLIASIGVIFQVLGILAWVWNVVRTAVKGKIAGDDPWDGWTLEWSTASPPPVYNFEKLPVVRSSRPLWDLKHPEDPDWKYGE